MHFFNKYNKYRFCFLFFFIAKKKKLGYKKIQWKLSSFFHANRIKYFFYFIKKLFLYKKFFFYFFINNILISLFKQLKLYYSSLLISKHINNEINIPFFFHDSAVFFYSTNFYSIKIKKIKYFTLFYIFYMFLFLKLFFFMFKHMNISYFSLPIKQNKYTILRSPHIDKKSREQFELKHFNVVINETAIFSLYKSSFLFNLFKYFISNLKIDEKQDILVI